MALHVPKAFASADERLAQALIREFPFAALVTVPAAATEPHVTHLPLLLEDGALLGHMARPNPHWQALARGSTLALFQGPHAYVSPRWYAAGTDAVPTWNYAVVHARVRPALLPDDETLALVKALTTRFDPGAPVIAPAKVQRLLRGIVGFRLVIEQLELKLKLSQNKDAADRAGVIAALAASGRAGDAEVAEWMRRA